jgi:hypothetical protein
VNLGNVEKIDENVVQTKLVVAETTITEHIIDQTTTSLE